MTHFTRWDFLDAIAQAWARRFRRRGIRPKLRDEGPAEPWADLAYRVCPECGRIGRRTRDMCQRCRRKHG